MGRRTRTGNSFCVNETGFTYLGLLFAVALMGISLAAVGVLWSTESQREKERELVFVGEQFRHAIAAYYEGSPGLVKRYPLHLEDLLRDNRFLGVKRHLRRIYADPMTGKGDWVIVRAPDGGVMGVHSSSRGLAINQNDLCLSMPEKSSISLPASERGDGCRYFEWVFSYEPFSQSVKRLK